MRSWLDGRRRSGRKLMLLCDIPIYSSLADAASIERRSKAIDTPTQQVSSRLLKFGFVFGYRSPLTVSLYMRPIHNFQDLESSPGTWPMMLNHSLTRLFNGNSQRACYALALTIFSLGLFRDFLFVAFSFHQLTPPFSNRPNQVRTSPPLSTRIPPPRAPVGPPSRLPPHPMWQHPRPLLHMGPRHYRHVPRRLLRHPDG